MLNTLASLHSLTVLVFDRKYSRQVINNGSRDNGTRQTGGQERDEAAEQKRREEMMRFIESHLNEVGLTMS